VTELNALQAALAAEHATIYGYGVAGARLHGADQQYAMASLSAHIAVRDQLIALISGMSRTPVAARAAYQLPFAVNTQAAARELAAHLEQGTAGAVWDLIAASTPATSVRSLAIGWLADAASRAAHWGTAQALPGQPA
jgi:Domain of unknown function (DUF4439)